MAFTITELHEMDTDVSHARVKHGAESFEAIISEPMTRLGMLNAEFLAEVEFHSISKHETGLTKDDSASGIFATDDPVIVIADGSVSDLLEIDSGHVLIDVYIQNGSEFVKLNSEDLGGVIPEVGSRIRLWLQGIRICPTSLQTDSRNRAERTASPS